ncbi:hypothetical protein NX774_12010 [Massilia agilis]|uniref:Uncharacterized protein n=1 Tax=Massilia agilis TaxID=1811226 RepID=A0ABT2DBF5_9BURK|nr:hypothetical protein [Massilia agilis]MCS0808644.1 hypothetical protein [Massilia agilis]
MALRWKKNPRPKGLAGVVAGPQGSELRDGERRYATTGYIDGRINKGRKSGWYWVAGWQSGVPHKNTCDNPVLDEETAKTAALEYVRKYLKTADSQKGGGDA